MNGSPSSPRKNSALKALNILRGCNSQDPSVRAHFDHQQKQSDNPNPQLQKAWFNSMKSVLQEVDEALRCIPFSVPLYFLDVGCCPGGFCSYILSKNLQSTGVGISLSEESGGHGFLLEDYLRPRLKLNAADLTYFQLGPTIIRDPRLRPLPFDPNTRPFDLVLLDGHPLRTYACTPATGASPAQMKSRLLISQLIICLQSTAISGTVIMKLAKPENPVTTKLLYMFDKLSLNLATWKPVCMHATRDTFYVVAKGFGCGKQWYMLGACPTGINAEDLDFIATQTELTTFQERLLQLSQHIWQVQASSLRGWKVATSEGF